MVELNHRERTIKVKIVYYGPPVCGKTTNLQVLHQHAQVARRGELISINSAQDRTILFDLLPLKAVGFRGFDLRLQVLAVPGQATYAATRRLVLKGADALVFVANSAADRWEENIQSFREMTQNLLTQQLDPTSLPLVLQYNKRDLPDVTPVEFMDRTLNARQVDAIPAISVRGEGVLETFAAILSRTMQDLATRYRIVEPTKGQTLHQWTNQAILGMFGAISLAAEPRPLPADTSGGHPPPPPPQPDFAPAAVPDRRSIPERRALPDRRTMRISVAEETSQTAGADLEARASETLVESYAQASTQLTAAVTELREELDTTLRRLEDIQQALVAAQEVLAGQPVEPILGTILARMADAAGASHASFLIPESDRSLRAAALRGLTADPLVKSQTGTRPVTARFLEEKEPRLHLGVDSLDLGDALEAAEPPFAAVVAVPLRTPLGLQALAMLYYAPDDAPPKADVVAHLGVISRAVSASLELARTLETARAAERTLHMALQGTASVRGLQQVVTFLEELRDRQGAMRVRPGVPDWFVDEFTRLAPSLAGALSTARSLLAFSRGEVQREVVGVEELMAGLRREGVAVQLGPGVDSVSGDPVLLRLALMALVDCARGAVAAEAPGLPLEVRAVAEGGLVRISVTEPAVALPYGFELPGSPPPAPDSATRDVSLRLVRRIAEIHGGSLTREAGPASQERYTLSLVPV